MSPYVGSQELDAGWKSRDSGSEARDHRLQAIPPTEPPGGLSVLNTYVTKQTRDMRYSADGAALTEMSPFSKRGDSASS